jgi:quercetin dioxygenase-like cupin family protein
MMAGMSGMTRRGVLVGGAAMVVAGGRSMDGQDVAAPMAAAGDFAGGSKVFLMGAVAATKNANGSERKSVLDGKLATGEVISMHESWEPAGVAVTLHKISHSEVLVVLEGTMAFEHDGRVDKAEAGDVVYVANGTTHAVKNGGTGTLRFMVLAVGGDVK